MYYATLQVRGFSTFCASQRESRSRLARSGDPDCLATIRIAGHGRSLKRLRKKFNVL